MTQVNDDWGDEPERPEPSWLTLQDAVDCLAESSKGGYIAAKECLFALISDGRLKMKCDATCEDSGFGKFDWVYQLNPFKHKATLKIPGRSGIRPIPRAANPKPLKPDYWLQAQGWNIDTNRTDFSSGLIVGTRPAFKTNKGASNVTKPAARRAAIGVLIEKDPAYFPDLAVGSSTQPSGQSLDFTGSTTEHKPNKPVIRTTRRGRPKLDPWNAWFAEVLIYAKVEGLDTSMAAADLNQIIIERIFARDPEQECLDFTTVDKAIGVIMKRWNEARRDGEIK